VAYLGVITWWKNEKEWGEEGEVVIHDETWLHDKHLLQVEVVLPLGVKGL